AGLAEKRDVEELYGDLAFEASVIALRQPHRSHATAADLRDQRVGADGLSGKPSSFRQWHDFIVEKTIARQGIVIVKKLLQTLGERRVFDAERGKPSRAFVLRHLERLV